MAIKIDNSNHSAPLSARKTDTPKHEPNATGTNLPTANAAEDRVTLTETASNLQSLLASLNEVPVVDSRRVDQVRAAISNGTYEVDTARVAEKLLQFESDL